MAGHVEVVMHVQSGNRVRSILFRGLSRFFPSFFFTFLVIFDFFFLILSITDDVAARPQARLAAYFYIIYR